MRFALIAAALLAVTALPTGAHAGETKGGPFAVLTCPAKGASHRTFDLSTGTAPWVVRGPGIPNGEALATRISDATIPPDWSARLPGAHWVQGAPQADAAAHAPGEYSFELTFSVPRGKRLPRLEFQGQAVADEGLDLTLIEPSPPGSFIGSGTGGADDSPGVVQQDEAMAVDLTTSADASVKPLGQRAGLYRLQITLLNGASNQARLGLLAQLRLTATCGAKK
jgi:hypothetical protein